MRRCTLTTSVTDASAIFTFSGSVSAIFRLMVCLTVAKPWQLERHRVVAGRQERDDVVAVGGGHGGAHALQDRRRRGDRDARHRQVVGVGDAAGNGAGRIALGEGGAGHAVKLHARIQLRDAQHDMSPLHVPRALARPERSPVSCADYTAAESGRMSQVVAAGRGVGERAEREPGSALEAVV